MRRLLIALMFLVAIVLMITPVFAHTTGSADYNHNLGVLGDLFDHDHSYTDSNTQSVKRWRVELGTDIIVQERQESQNNLWPMQTQFQGRYDFNNRVGGVAIVATYHLKDIWKGIVDVRDDVVNVLPFVGE